MQLIHAEVFASPGYADSVTAVTHAYNEIHFTRFAYYKMAVFMRPSPGTTITLPQQNVYCAARLNKDL